MIQYGSIIHARDTCKDCLPTPPEVLVSFGYGFSGRLGISGSSIKVLIQIAGIFYGAHGFHLGFIGLLRWLVGCNMM